MNGGVRAIPVRLRRRRAGADASGPTPETGPVPYSTACAAPAVQLRFETTGIVTSCCRTVQPLGHLGRQRLREIWDGEVRRRREAALERWDFSEGCEPCGAEIAVEGHAASYAAIHDEFAVGLTSDPATRAWPRRMELNLSNSCNLQCIQCDGDSSSSIRIHREHRPPQPKIYDDRFFEDLREFLPHLDHVVVAGGEPFLSAEAFRLFDLIADEAPHVRVRVVTNATQWNRRVESVLERLPLHFVFSLDGITADTYEAVRIGADLDEVLTNVDRFVSYTRDRGTTASVNFCLMPQNHHEFGDLLCWAADRDLPVDVSVVRAPARACLTQLPADELRAVHATMASQDAALRPRLGRNLATWERELARVAAWADGGLDAEVSSRTVMWFRCAGTAAHDDVAARDELADLSVDGRVDSIDVDDEGRIRDADVTFADGSALPGGSVNDFTALLARTYGDMVDYEVVASSPDRVDARATFGTTGLRVTSVALRDGQGWAERARVLVAVVGVVGAGSPS